MHYLALLGAIVTAVGACSDCPLDSAPGTAHALNSHFDMTRLPADHIIKYTSSDRAGPETTGFSYTKARSDEWVPIDPQHVDVSQRGETTIRIDPLHLDPNTKYKLGYLVGDLRGRQVDSSEFIPPRSDEAETSTLTSVSSPSSTSRSRTTSKPSYSSTTSTQASTVQSSLSTTQTPITTTTQDLNTGSASATPSASTMNSGARGTINGPAACFWIFLFLAF